MKELWHSKGFANSYCKFEKTSTRPASSLISQCNLSSKSKGPIKIFDNACGTGIVTSLLCDEIEFSQREDIEILAGDISIDMIESTKKRIEMNNWKCARAEVIDSQDTKLPSNYFDYVITNFGIFLVPCPTSALSECVRMTKPGGLVSFSTWQSLGWTQIISDTLTRIPKAPSFGDIREILWGKTGAWHDLAMVRSASEIAGLKSIRVVTMAFYSMFDNPKAYVEDIFGLLDKMKWLLPLGELDPLREPLRKEMEIMLLERHGNQAFGVPFVAILCTGTKEVEAEVEVVPSTELKVENLLDKLVL